MLANLEMQIEATPSDRGAWLVYADALQTLGDPRGELIVRSMAHASNEHIVEEHRRTLFGDTPGLMTIDEFELFLSTVRWRHGFVESGVLRVENESAARLPNICAALLSAPIARFLSMLDIPECGSGLDQDDDFTGLFPAILLAGADKRIKHLRLGDFDRGLGDLTNLWGSLSKLESLYLRGSRCILGRIVAPQLERLQIRTISAAELEAIASGVMPKLVDLTITIAGSASGATNATLIKLFERADLACLRRLNITGAGVTVDALAALASSRLLQTLEYVCLPGGTLGDGDVKRLSIYAPAFSRLKELNLTSHRFTLKGLLAMGGAFKAFVG